MSFASSSLNEIKKAEHPLAIPQELYIPLVDLSIFDNITIDEHSLSLVELGNTEQRYAVVGFIDEDDRQLYLYFRPSFTIDMALNYDEEEKQKIINNQQGRKNFNLEDIVEAPSNVTGIVHHNTIASIRQYFKTRDIYVPHLKYTKMVGLSFRKCSENILNWLSRSTLNYQAFDTNPVASACFHFDQTRYDFDRPYYLNIYHLQRTLEPNAFNKIRAVVKKSLLKQHGLKDILADEIKKDKNNELEISMSTTLFGMEQWPKISKDKTKIAEYMARTIYYSSGLLSRISPSAPFQPDNAEVIYTVLKIAIKYDISLNLKYIPSDNTFSKFTALELACKKGDLESANLLLDYDAQTEEKAIDLLVKTAKDNNELLAEALAKYCNLSKIKIETIKNVLIIMNKNIQVINPAIEKEKQTQELSDLINNKFDSKTALMGSIDMNHFEIARLLVHSSTEAALNDALLYAIEKSKVEFVNIILEKPFYILFKNNKLRVAASRGNIQIIKLLQTKGAEVYGRLGNEEFNINLQTGILELAKKGDYFGVQQLQIEYKMDLNQFYGKEKDYKVCDKLFEIFITDHVVEGNVEAMKEMQKHMPDLYENYINRKYFNAMTSDSEKYSLALKLAVSNGQIRALKLIFNTHEKIDDIEKEKLIYDCLLPDMVICAKNQDYIGIFNILNNNNITIKINKNRDSSSLEDILFSKFRKHILDKDLRNLKSFYSCLPDLYQLFLNKTDTDGRTMIFSITHSSDEIIKFLLKNDNINLEACDDVGNTVLLKVAQSLDRFSIALLLLAKGANVEAVNHAGETVADYFAKHIMRYTRQEMNFAAFDILSECKKYNIKLDFYKPSKKTGKTMEHCFKTSFFNCVNQGDSYSVKQFKKFLPELFTTFLNGKDSEGNTPIMLAASQERLTMLKVLIEEKVNLELKNIEKNTVLSISALQGNLAFVKTLLDEKANPNIQNIDGLNLQDCLAKGLNKKLTSKTKYLTEIMEFEKHYPGIIDYYKLLDNIGDITDLKVFKFILEDVKVDLLKSRPQLNNILLNAINKNKLDISLFLLSYGATLTDSMLDEISRVRYRQLNEIADFKEQDFESKRFQALQKIYSLKIGEYENILPIFHKLDEVTKELSSIQDCKGTKEIIKNVYQDIIENPDKAENIFNNLLKIIGDFNKKLTTSITYRGVSRIYASSNNMSIKIKLDNIIMKFNQASLKLLIIPC
jgi:ankyrin repeat protein